jgi:hypothetical protein
MPIINVISEGMSGVDMKTNPLSLPEERLAGSTNVMYDEGSIKTRPGFRYHDLGVSGVFQGASVYSPSRGMSHLPFADPFTVLVLATCGGLSYNLSKDGYLADPVMVEGDVAFGPGDVNLFQAENYLIVHEPGGATRWWEGWGPVTVSPGLDASGDVVEELLVQSNLRTKELPGANIECCFQQIEYCEVTPLENPEEPWTSHDTLVWENHRNFLLNSAGLGIYANGRIHQESPNGIYVSDLIHKRGTRLSDDILLMEEQQAGPFGDPLSVNSRLGQLRALEVYPAMNSANGEEEIIAYYDTGVVSFRTSQVPRETRTDAETGETLQQGWDSVRLVNHLLNRVSATGRYAVAVLPRDHAFRSRFGIHLLRTSIGDGVFNDEFINTLSQDVQPILDADDKSNLKGTTLGQWIEGNRILTSVGMVKNNIYSSSAHGRGFVVWNQAATFTEDRTPRPVWEGLWSPHNEVAGVHRLLDVSEVAGENMFGFVASKKCGALVFGEISSDLSCDILDNKNVLIEWDVTSRKIFGGFGIISRLTDGRLELVASGAGGRARVMVRSDVSPDWKEWKEETTSDAATPELKSINLGQPPIVCREASWFQFRVEGLGYAEIRQLEVEITQDRGKIRRTISTHDVSMKPESLHRINQHPSTERWR